MNGSVLERLSLVQEERLVDWLHSGFAHEYSTDPANRRVAEASIKELYKAANMVPPKIIWCASPLQAYVARAIVRCMVRPKFEDYLAFADDFPGMEEDLIGINVRAFIRDATLDKAERALRSDVSPELWAALSSIKTTEPWSQLFQRRVATTGTISDAINRISYFTNAKLLKDGSDKHEGVPDSIWKAACISAEKLMGRAIPTELRNYRQLACHRWPTFFDSLRGRTECGYGQHDWSAIAVYSFLNSVPELSQVWQNFSRSLDALDKLASSVGWYLPHRNVCWLTERHDRILFDERGRLHNESGPAISFPDGWNLYLWHGVRVNEKIIMRPDELTLRDIDREENTEVRSVMMQRYGEERYFLNGKVETIDHDPR
jgi:hypothetical protein